MAYKENPELLQLLKESEWQTETLSDLKGDEKYELPSDEIKRRNYEEKISINELLVVNAVKTRLEAGEPLIFTTEIENSIDAVEEDFFRQNKRLISYWHNNHGIANLSKPVFGGSISNKHFHSDPQIGFMLVSRGIEEALESRKTFFPAEIRLNVIFPGLRAKSKFDKNGKYIGKSSEKEFIIYRNNERMLDGLYEEISRQRMDKNKDIFRQRINRNKDIFYKRPSQ